MKNASAGHISPVLRLGLLLVAFVGASARDSLAAEDLCYVLQPEVISAADLAAPGFDWIVLEPTRDGGASGDLTPAEIDQIRTTGPCTPQVLAYLSIGEAEDYRDYWDPSWVDGDGDPIPGVAPDWLGPQNPDWPGNYKVRYWHTDWQALLFGTASGPDKTPLDRIIDQGFDGVYLDIVDGYEYWSDPNTGIPELSRMTARAYMVDLVEAIADYARQTRGISGFLVFPQNAADIVRDDSYAFDADTTRYFAAVSGIGQEDLYYDEVTPQPVEETDYVLEQLGEFVSRGKTVLVTDYVIRQGNPGPGANDARVSDFHARCRSAGFVPYAAHRDRDLDEIVTFGGVGWSVDQPAAGCALRPGDVNGDGSVDLTDLGIMLIAFGACTGEPEYVAGADVNSDGCIDLTDLGLLLLNFTG